MKLANYQRDGLNRAALVVGDRLYDIAAEAEKNRLSPFGAVTGVDQLLEENLVEGLLRDSSRISSGEGVPLSSVKLKSPVLYPQKIFMVAVNYGSHGKETNTPPPAYPYLFTKFQNSLIGPEEPIVAPQASKKVDWEVELAVVIGREGKNIERKDALGYVAGYTVSNDISYRDFQGQKNESLGLNWVKGKGLDASLPLGPWLVTKEEIPDPQNLSLSLKVNGKVQQNANTSEMLIKVDELVAYASIATTLKPGDIISTGTPEGIAAATGEPYLKDGDVVEATIEKIGTLRNPVKAER